MKGVVPIRGDRRVFVIQGVGDVSFVSSFQSYLYLKLYSYD